MRLVNSFLVSKACVPHSIKMSSEIGVFNSDGKYYAHLSSDGKLKLWNTLSNALEEEYTPDYHLVAPFSCLHFYNPPQFFSKVGTDNLLSNKATHEFYSGLSKSETEKTQK